MKVIVICLSATAALTCGPAPGVRVTGYSPVRLSFKAANDEPASEGPRQGARPGGPLQAVT